MSACINWFFFREYTSPDSLVDFVKNTEEVEESTITRQICSAKIAESSSAPSASSSVTTKVTVARTSRKPGQDNKVQVKNTFFTFREIVSR